MNEWIDELADLAAAGEPAVLVTVAGIRGSAPREIGAKMIVTAAASIGTIGGGQLEYQSTRVAVGMLDDERTSLRSFPLGSSMGQCCGGVVDVLVVGDLSLRQVVRRFSGVHDSLGREVNPVVWTREEFERRRACADHFLIDVLSGPTIMIVGEPVTMSE